MKSILITGGAGFIGSNLTLGLIEKGYAITVLDNLSPQIHDDSPLTNSYLFLSIKDKVNFINGSVTNKDDLLRAIRGNDVIIHLAAETGTGQSMYEIEKYINVNISGTGLLLDLLANTEHSVKKFIVASSRSIYGEGKYKSKEKGIVYPKHRLSEAMANGDFDVKYPGCIEKLEVLPTDEESRIHPSSVYGITKQNQEQMVMTVCPTIGIEPVAFRYQNVYGPGQSLSNPYTGILSIFSTLIRNQKEINIFEDGMETRDFVFIKDVVSATILGIEKESANGEIFNVGTGIPINVVIVAEELMRNYNIKVPLMISGNYRLGDIRHNFADLTKIKNLLGFQPSYSFDQGIKLFTDWVLSQDVAESKYEKSVNEMKAKGLMK